MSNHDTDRAAKHGSTSEDDPSAIERDIERTRADMSDTLEAIQQKLSPSNLMDQALEYFQEGPAQAITNLGEIAARNPVPLALIGLGLGWIAISGLRSTAETPAYRGRRAPARGTVGRLADSAKESVTGAVSQVGQQAGQLYDSVRDKASQLADQAAEHVDTDRINSLVSRAGLPVRSFAESQPLLLGAVGLAIGAAIGASFSPTSVENRLMGATRDDLVGRAREMGQEQLHRVQDAAERTIETMREEVGNEGLTPGKAAETLSDKLTRVAEAGYNTAKEELTKDA